VKIMTRIAYLVSSARDMTLADGSTHPTGYFAEEALKPYERFAAAGFDLMIRVGRVIATGDVVTALLRAEGTQAAGYAGAINTEKHLDIDQAWRFVTAGGLITEVAAYWCQAQLYRRLAVKRYDEIAIA